MRIQNKNFNKKNECVWMENEITQKDQLAKQTDFWAHGH